MVSVMNLKDYERVKFQLAEVLREAKLAEASRGVGADDRWRPLFARLAEDRFNVVVAGRFSQGKSTLLNALLGMDRLPTGLVPITSVITTVRYGTSERVTLEYENARLPGNVALEDLALYVTEKGNPGNRLGIRSAEIQLPAEILRRGFFFVDTPGLGSAILQNTETTRRFIPEIDVLILVTSYDSPLTEDEADYLSQASPYARSTFVVLNKQDLVAPEARSEVLAYAERVVADLLGERVRKPYSVSAREALEARCAGDADQLLRSGLLQFEEDLSAHLTTRKTELFLSSLCDRTLAALQSSPAPQAAALVESVSVLQQRLRAGEAAADERVLHRHVGEWETVGPAAAGSIDPCEICRAVADRVFDFLRHYQYDLSTQRAVQGDHAERGGFCPLHSWHYEQITSPRGACTAYPVLLNRVARELRALAEGADADLSAASGLFRARCPACEVRQAAEDRAVRSILARSRMVGAFEEMALSALCLPHLRMVLRATDDAALRAFLLHREASLLERTAEDMLRYAMRFDGLKRHLASEEEKGAPVRAIRMLVGAREVNAVASIDEIT